MLKDSDDFTEGSYVLLLPNPVRGGNYSCEIPQLFHREACVTAGQHVKVKDTVMVDEVGHVLSVDTDNHDVVGVDLDDYCKTDEGDDTDDDHEIDETYDIDNNGETDKTS